MVDARVTRWTAAGGAAVRGVGGAGRRVGAAVADQRTVGCVLRVVAGSDWWRCPWPFGPVWRRDLTDADPWYLVLRRILPARPAVTYPETWGYRPAALGLFAFVWMELASPNPASLPWVEAWLLTYAVAMLGGAWAVRPALAGPDPPIRRVQRGGVAIEPVSPQPGHREDRGR